MKDLRHSFELLDLDPGATAEEVKRGYRDMISIWHPDRFAGNPRLQRKVEEKLKEINEAYALIMAGLTPTAEKAPVRSPSPPPAAACARTERQTAPPASPADSCDDGGKATLPTVTFSVPNILFLFFGFVSLILSTRRFGPSPRAFAYMLEMGFIPLLFALAHNIIARENRRVRMLYMAFTLLFALIATLDTMTQQDLTGFDDYLSPSERYASPSYPSAGRPLSLDFGASPDFPGARAPAGPPRAPIAPAAPLAPMAPAAPIVPPAR